MPTPNPEKEATQTFNRGDIYYIYKFPSSGSEQRSGRPAVIVSNNDCNHSSPVIEVCYLTLQKKSPIPTHVIIDEGPCDNSTILCEQIHSVDIDRVGDFIGVLPKHLEEPLNEALRVSLALSNTSVKEVIPDSTTSLSVKQELDYLRSQVHYLEHEKKVQSEKLLNVEEANKAIKKNCAEAMKKAEMYEMVYNTLLDKLISRGVK